MIAATEGISPVTAPLPTNDAERLVFRHLYGTAARRDCADQLRPWVAARIEADSVGEVWIAELRGEATFSDGDPVTAQAIIDQWRAIAGGDPDDVVSVRAIGERRLEVGFAHALDSLPGVFTDAAFAVAGARSTDGWPASSGAYQIDSGPGGFRSTPRLTPRFQNGLPRIELRLRPGTDARDLLDQGADLLITRDPQTIAYAHTDSGFRDIPLAWDRVYALVSSGMDSSATTRSSLAQAVRAEVRPASGPYWWTGGTPCRVTPSRSAPRTIRILYLRGDPTARDLAERTVALAVRYPQLASALGSGSSPIAVPVSAGALNAALAQGNDAGYVIALPRLAPASCVAAPPLPAAANILPLVESRAHALLRRGTTGLLLDADGGVHVTGIDHEFRSP